jgi:proteasome lid subunit RPN8/RPN11
MRAVQLPGIVLDRLRQESLAGYPDEVCGFLLARADAADGAVRGIRATEAAPNAYAGERRRRFVIPPEELHLAERRAESRGEVVVGFYHSHPDHPAVPSDFDAEHAWPWYTYLVLSVDRRGAGEAGAFELDAASGRFHPCSLTAPTDAAVPVLAPPARGR